MNYTYKISKRGLTSTLNSLLGLFIEHSLENKGQIYIDSSSSPYFKKVSFYDIFKTNAIFTDEKPTNPIIIKEKQARKFSAKNYKTLMPVDQMSKVFSYKDDMLSLIKDNIKSLNLPQEFSCFHIRRGDKVLEKPYDFGKKESERFEFSDYLEKAKNIGSIFIMTDDYKAIVEAKEYLIENKLNHKLFYLTKQTQDGHSEQLDVEQNREYTKTELVSFFTEIEIAKLSSCFVGAQTSNVFRFIKNTCITKNHIRSVS